MKGTKMAVFRPAKHPFLELLLLAQSGHSPPKLFGARIEIIWRPKDQMRGDPKGPQALVAGHFGHFVPRLFSSSRWEAAACMSCLQQSLICSAAVLLRGWRDAFLGWRMAPRP